MAEVLVDQFRFELVAAGGNGRMHGKNITRLGGFGGFVECHPFAAAKPSDALQRHESRMTFVHMADRRLNAHRQKRLHAPYA